VTLYREGVIHGCNKQEVQEGHGEGTGMNRPKLLRGSSTTVLLPTNDLVHLGFIQN